MFSLSILQSALELGCIYSLVALALFLSFRVLNIADMTTDGAFTLGCAVSATAAVAGHPILGLFLAMAAGAAAGAVTALLQTRLGVPSILAGIVTNTGLYTVNLAVMGFSSNVPMLKTETVFTAAQAAGVPVVSAMGAGNKLDPARFRVSDLAETKTDPLARIMRRELKKRGVEHLPVVWSDELPMPVHADMVGSVSFVPSVMGLIMAGHIVKELAK